MSTQKAVNKKNKHMYIVHTACIDYLIKQYTQSWHSIAHKRLFMVNWYFTVKFVSQDTELFKKNND